MPKNAADIKLAPHSGLRLPLPEPGKIHSILILGNTIGMWGYPGEEMNMGKLDYYDAERFAWMFRCVKEQCAIEILGEIEEYEHYSEFFKGLEGRYGIRCKVSFTEMKENAGYETKLNEYIEEMKNTGKKRFDFAIMNPPYDRNLHLKFLEKVIKVADKTVNISPVRWLQDPLARYKKNSDYNRFENSVSKHIESLTIIEASKGTELFGGEGMISMTKDMGIYICTSKGGFDYSKVYFKRGPMDLSVFEKLSKFCNGLPWVEYRDSAKDCFVTVRRMASSHRERGEYTVPSVLGNTSLYGIFSKGLYRGKTLAEIKKGDNHSTVGTVDTIRVVEFKSVNEAKNFVDSCCTTIYKYIVLGCTPAEEIDLSHLPWTGDYTKPWTNARFCEYFGITGFISDTEAEPGSEWETILETMKKYA